MSKSINLTLREAGLSAKEAALYVAMLSLGEVGITDLAAKAKLKKSTAYMVVESLREKGLVGSFRSRSGTKFVATSPKQFLDRAQKQLDELQTVIPRLEALQRSQGVEPTISYYRGKEGYFIAVADFLKVHNSTVRQMGSLTEIQSVIGAEYDTTQIVPERIKNNIFLRALYFPSEMNEVAKRDHTGELREIRLMPDQFFHRAYTMIYGDKVAIVSSRKELVTVIIESAEVAESERQKFDLLWNLLGESARL